MLIRIGKLVLTAFAVETLTILVLVLLVGVLGPSDPEEAAAYAERLGAWVGPIAGFILCLAGGWLVARKTEHPLAFGVALGVLVAAIDVTLLVSGGVAFQVLFVVSNLGRVIAGALGGWLATPGAGAQQHG